ncbi:MAG TPA: flavodoxin family protein [Devosiaceae bacterium]|jgi:multimeric flavodoxin WrbA
MANDTLAAPTEPRKGMPATKIAEAAFKERFLGQYIDPAFDSLRDELEKVAAAAWDGYSHSRKSPRTVKAGPGYADPDYDLAVDWVRARDALKAAEADYRQQDRAPRVLLINASPRNEHTCPGEMSKSYRLADLAKAQLEADGVSVEVLDLSLLTAEYGRNIHPCKACFSTAAPLCHWPCSCYPNYSLGQTQDWMNDIYPMWMRADGIMIVTPVHWYQVSSPLKLMMDRLVCADGGNPDPTLTQGKTAALAKKLELDGWDYPRPLKGRVFSVIVHGDVEGAEGVRRSVSDWLSFMHMLPAGKNAEVDRYIGYWQPYATSHEALDGDIAVQGEVRNAAKTLGEAVKAKRAGALVMPGEDLHPVRQK